MRRREFIAGLGATAWPLATRAQQAALPLIGFINQGSADANARQVAAFRKRLGETGYVEGQNVTIEYHWLDGQYDRLPALMADLLRRPRLAVIATPANTPGAIAAKAATATIPIVFGVGEDPVRQGLVVSPARPGGNATGVNFFTTEVVAKRLELLHKLVPKAVRIAELNNPANVTATETTLRDVQEAARSIGLHIDVLNASTSRRSMPHLLSLRGTGPTPSSSLPTHSSAVAASNSPPWQRTTGFRRLIRIAIMSQSAG